VPLQPGFRLGPYEIQATLGAGGMGEVYKARDTRLDRTVAIKVLPPQLAGDPQFRERFDREGRAVSALDHPHICALYDVGEHEGTAYLVMQHLEGETLAERLGRSKDRPLPHPIGSRSGARLLKRAGSDPAVRRGRVSGSGRGSRTTLWRQPLEKSLNS